jgi:predicted ferric reductase
VAGVVTWVVLRAAGIAAYLMLWATVTWGLIGTTSLVGKRVARATAITIHQFLANTALLLLGVHIGGILLDTYVHFAPIDLFVPLHTTHRTVPVAVGILAMYAFMVVLVSSWIRKHLGTRIWRAAHLLAVPAFALALVHGVFAGTDTVRPWMWWGYVLTGAFVLFLMLTRALTIGLRPERRAPHGEPAGRRAPRVTADAGTR